MVPRSSLRPALAALAATAAALVGTVAVPVAGPAASAIPAQLRGNAATQAPASPIPAQLRRNAAPPDTATPLTVRIGNLSPASIPRRGPVRVSGTVTNDDDVPWTGVQAYAFVSSEPMTSRDELAAAAEVPADAPVGERILEPGSYDGLGRIEPGETVRFSLRVPRASLPTERGVYWFGVHALGSDGGPEELVPVADGRARTFLPLVPEGARAPTTDVAVVVPLRRAIRHTVDGAVVDVAGWTRSLDEGGRLRSLLDLGAAAEPGAVSWLVDPALLDAVARLSAGNPPRSLAPTLDRAGGEDDADADDEPGSGDAGTEPSGTPDASLAPDPTAPATPDDGAQPEPEDPELARTATVAGAWLEDLREVLAEHEVLALPYGDVDVAAAAEHDPSLYRTARQRSTQAMAAWDLDAAPAVAPPSGYLDAAALRMIEDGARVLLADRAVPGGAGVLATAGNTVLAASSGAAAGGPDPTRARSALAMRQRLAAEAAVRARRTGGTLTVVLPHDWVPRAPEDYLDGLDGLGGPDGPGWLDLTDTAQLASGPRVPAEVTALRYPERQERAEVPAENFAVARSLISSGEALQNLLVRNDQVAAVVAGEALSGTSYAARAPGELALLALEGARGHLAELLGSIEIVAPRGVTLSSSSGRFAATVSNGLDQPVIVQVEALADEPLEVATPDPVTIGPGGRTTVLLDAATDRVGVHGVTLLVTDVEGTPLGSTDRLPVRSAQVSQVIWVIIGAGAGLLLGAVVLRLVRRFRGRTDPTAEEAA